MCVRLCPPRPLLLTLRFPILRTPPTTAHPETHPPSIHFALQGAESARAALADFFTKKKSRLQRPLLEGLLRRVPALLPAALPEALKQAAAGRNEYLRHEAFELLGAALKVGTVHAAERGRAGS